MTDVSDRPGFYRVMVAIETDATRYYGPDASRPALLEATQAEQMLAHLAADMQALLPDISRCGLIAAGALYDQTQVLRPGYPVFAALEATATPGAGRFQPGLVSIGGTGGRMPESTAPRRWLPKSAMPWNTASSRRGKCPRIRQAGWRRLSGSPSTMPG
jgi:hypothetical protein